MNMFCYQCQDAGFGKGCTSMGACGKTDETANLQDLLIWLLKGLAVCACRLDEKGMLSSSQKRTAGTLVTECLFTTVTNTDFDPQRIIGYAERVIARRDILRRELEAQGLATLLPENATWSPPASSGGFHRKSLAVGILQTRDADIRSLRETVTYALKGLSAYTYHAAVLGHYDDSIFDRIFHGLAATTRDISKDDLVRLVLETGKCNISAMALLDGANTAVYGAPSATKVETGVRGRPGILVSGHELKDLEMLLEQAKDKGVDIYTNGEMILAQSLPFFRKYPHLAGNYGNAWWQQVTEFASFNGPVLVTSNCIMPPEEGYKDRLFTTSIAGYPGIPHIEEKDGSKDFSPIIYLAQRCPPPSGLNEPDIYSGFGHLYLSSVKEKVLDLIRRGKIKKFVVMAGCDGRDQRRVYYKEKALSLPPDTIILTAGCAKYRYIKHIPDDIEGIPRVLDAGQCSDSYSLVVFALEMVKELGVKDINDLPVEFDLAWYDQKAVAIFLSLLYLGVRRIKLGPTLPEYFLQYLAKHLPEGCEVTTVTEDR